MAKVAKRGPISLAHRWQTYRPTRRTGRSAHLINTQTSPNIQDAPVRSTQPSFWSISTPDLFKRLKTTLNPSEPRSNLTGGKEPKVSDQLLEKARAHTDTVLKELGSRSSGLSGAEADSRVKHYGLNEVAREKRQSALARRMSSVRNPLVILLTALGVISFLTVDQRATAVIFVMVLLGVVLRFYLELRADLRPTVKTPDHNNR